MLLCLLHRYAFITHRSSEEANRNLCQPLNRSFLGSKCSVQQLIERQPNLQSISSESEDKYTIVAKNIPPQSDQIHLQHLFPNGFIIKYCPARSVGKTTKSNSNSSKGDTMLTGYDPWRVHMCAFH